MEKYNYYESVKEDVKRYIIDEYDVINMKYIDRDLLYDELWTADCVTGNGSGSYTFNAYEAEENLLHNLDLLKEACDEFGCDTSDYLENPEAADVTIRCYILSSVINDAIDELLESEAK